MPVAVHCIEATIRYLTPSEGGRRTGLASGYRGQFHYQGEDWEGFQLYPDLPEGEFVQLGVTVRAFVVFVQDRWEEVHSKRLRIGTPFKIRERQFIVGQGLVTRLNVNESEQNAVIK